VNAVCAKSYLGGFGWERGRYALQKAKPIVENLESVQSLMLIRICSLYDIYKIFDVKTGGCVSRKRYFADRLT